MCVLGLRSHLHLHLLGLWRPRAASRALCPPSGSQCVWWGRGTSPVGLSWRSLGSCRHRDGTGPGGPRSPITALPPWSPGACVVQGTRGISGQDIDGTPPSPNYGGSSQRPAVPAPLCHSPWVPPPRSQGERREHKAPPHESRPLQPPHLISKTPLCTPFSRSPSTPGLLRPTSAVCPVPFSRNKAACSPGLAAGGERHLDHGLG